MCQIQKPQASTSSNFSNLDSSIGWAFLSVQLIQRSGFGENTQGETESIPKVSNEVPGCHWMIRVTKGTSHA